MWYESGPRWRGSSWSLPERGERRRRFTISGRCAALNAEGDFGSSSGLACPSNARATRRWTLFVSRGEGAMSHPGVIRCRSYICSSRSTSRLRNTGSSSHKAARCLANSAVSGRLEFSIARS
jgi:hypothetical protein